MPGLAQSLEGQDLGHFRIVAEQWGFGLQARDTQQALERMEAMLPEAVANGWQKLPDEARVALQTLAAAGGRIAWPKFTHQFGEVREMGPGRRDKEQPNLNPVSATERLWYRGLIGRAFFDSAKGLAEFAYIPDELLAVLPHATESAQPFGRPARPEERAVVKEASDRIVDQACTLLCGQRLTMEDAKLQQAEDWLLSLDDMRFLVGAAGTMDVHDVPYSENTRRFLKQPRGVALRQLATTWLVNEQFDEMRRVPGLRAEGNWDNNAHAARHKIIGYLQSAPHGQWWSLPALLEDVKRREPDFQRPPGDFDSWYLRDEHGEYKRGFQFWDAVEGALIAYIVKIMHLHGFLDLASPSEGKPTTAFRWSRLAPALLDNKEPAGLPAETAKVRIDSRGKILVPPLTARATRYLIGRFCEWLPKQKDGYLYQVTARSLERARKQNLKVSQLVALLQKSSTAPLPPNLLQALKRWEQQGSQAKVRPGLVLRVGSAAALKALHASKAARYLGEPLGPTAVAVKAGAGQQVLQALVELGYFGELEGDEE